MRSPNGSFVFVTRAASSALENGSYTDKHNEIIKIDQYQNVVWNTTLSYFPNGDQWLTATNDGGYAVAGSSLNVSAFGWLVKVDANGGTEWNQTYQQVGVDVYINHAIQTQDGGFALIASVSDGRSWFIKTDSNGSKKLDKMYESPSLRLVAETADGGYVLAGDNNIEPEQLITHLVKVSQDGNVVWERTYGEQLGYRPRILASTSEGGFIMAGACYLNNTSVAAFALKTDSQGYLEWNKTYGENSGFRTLAENKGNGFVFAGGVYNSQPRYSARLVETDQLGNEKWTAIFNGKGNGYVYSVLQTEDGGYVFAGATGEPDSSMTNIWIVKTVPSSHSNQTDWIVIVASIIVLISVLTVGIVLYRKRKKHSS